MVGQGIMSRSAVRVLTLALFVACLAPPSQAELVLTVAPPAGVIPPETGVGLANVTFTMDCQSALRHAPSPVADTIIIQVTASTSDPEVHTNGPTNVALSSAKCMSGASATEASADYQVSASRKAPGLVPVQVAFKANVRAGNAVDQDEEADAAFNVTVDYFAYISSRVQQASLDVPPGGPARFVVEVSNFGNAATQVSFATQPAAAPAGWSWEAPAPVILGTPNLGEANTANVTFEVTGDGDGAWTNKELPLMLTMTPSAAAEPGKVGTPITVSVFPRALGTPGPDAFAVLAILGGALVARRRA